MRLLNINSLLGGSIIPSFKEGRLPKRFGKMVSQTFKSRQISDYEAFVVFEKEELSKLFTDMKDFIFAMEEYLNN